MSLNPIFDTLEHDILDGAHAVAGWFDRKPPAQAAATETPTEEHTMSVSLTGIAGDIKNAIENADQWVKEVTEQHLPAILAQAAKYEQSPIVQALEGALLPPGVEQQIANMITELSKQFPAQAVPVTPAEPVPAGQ